MKKNKITFLFNQLLTEDLCSGGEIRGRIIAQFFQKDKDFDVEIIIPKISLSSFKDFKTILIGNNRFEKKINQQNLISAFILFCTRTLELTYRQSILKTDILYSTGDFFCNIIPSFIVKIIRPKTKFIVCVHHLNENPFKRKSNPFIASTISFFNQRLSFFLIKLKADTIFVVNNQVKQYFLDKNYKKPIIVAGNGLDTNLIESQINSLKNIKASNHICYFGRLSPTKGVLDFPILLSEVIKKYPKIHLDLIGIVQPGIKEILIKKFNQNNCQGHYTIHNFIDNKIDIFKIILKSKVIVFPSYEEGWGISLFESIMTKRPVVAYNLPIFKEIFKNKLETAPIGNIQILSQKTIKFIKNYSLQSTKKYIDVCYQTAKKYDWNSVFAKEKKAIKNIL